LNTVPKEIMEAGMLRSHACTTTNIIRLLRTREKVLEINDCTQTDHPEFLLHHSPKILQLSDDLLSCQLFPHTTSRHQTGDEEKDEDENERKKEERTCIARA